MTDDENVGRDVESFNSRLLVRIAKEAKTDPFGIAALLNLNVSVCKTIRDTPESDLVALLPNQFQFLARLRLPETFWSSTLPSKEHFKPSEPDAHPAWFDLNQEFLLKSKELATNSIPAACFALDIIARNAAILASASIDMINGYARTANPVFTVELDHQQLCASLKMTPESAQLYSVMYKAPRGGRDKPRLVVSK